MTDATHAALRQVLRDAYSVGRGRGELTLDRFLRAEDALLARLEAIVEQAVKDANPYPGLGSGDPEVDRFYLGGE